MSTSNPFVSGPYQVEEGWIDYNGHMNMAYYNVLFDRCADDAFKVLGMGAQYVEERGMTIYTAEVHICYVRELHLNDKVFGTFQLLDHNDKCFHTFQELKHEDGWLAATAEVMTLHVDMSGPKVCPFPADILANLEAMRSDHAGLPVPERAGRSIGIRRRKG